MTTVPLHWRLWPTWIFYLLTTSDLCLLTTVSVWPLLLHVPWPLTDLYGRPISALDDKTPSKYCVTTVSVLYSDKFVQWQMSALDDKTPSKYHVTTVSVLNSDKFVQWQISALDDKTPSKYRVTTVSVLYKHKFVQWQMSAMDDKIPPTCIYLWLQLLFDISSSTSTVTVDRFVQWQDICVGWQNTIYLPCDDRFCLTIFLQLVPR